jgi:hypothetical protein
MCAVWNAPATCSGTIRALAGERGQLLRRAGGDDLPRGVSVRRRQPVLLDRRGHVVRVPAEHRTHARRPHGTGVGHRPAPLADEHERLLGREDAGEGGGRQLADGVAGDGVGDPGRVVRLVERAGQEGGQGHEPGRDDERLRDGGVADRLGVRGRAVGDEVEPGDGTQPSQPLGDVGHLQPRGEEAGGLGALPRAGDR